MNEMLNRISQHGPSRRLVIALSVCSLLALTGWLQHRSLRSARSTHETLTRQVEQMSVDAARIETLRAAPRLATEREKPNEELLAQIRDSMIQAKIPIERWIGNEPSPAMRLPKSPYKRLHTRVSFESVPIKGLATFLYDIRARDPSLSVSRTRLSALNDHKNNEWDVEATLSYLLYSPHGGN